MLTSLPHPRGGLSLQLDRPQNLSDPAAELSRFGCVGADENRRALHGLLHDGGFYAAAFGKQPHATVVTGHQGSLRGGQRNKKIALREFAVDVNWSGDPDGNLCDTDKVLDVPADRRIERVVREDGKTGAGLP